MVSLSTDRWFFSLLSEHWRGEHSATGVDTDLPIKQVRGLCVAGGLLDEDFNCLWDLVIVEKILLMTFDRDVIGQKTKTPHGEKVHKRSCSDPIHMEQEKLEIIIQKDEREDGKNMSVKRDQTHKRMTRGWDDAHKNLSQCCVTNH